jgi:hypothetical protein
MPRRLTLIAALLALGLAGCGDDDKDKSGSSRTQPTTGASSVSSYKLGLGKAISGFQAAGQDFKNAVNETSSLRARAGALDEYQGRVTSAADDLQALSPPRNVAAAHRSLTDALRKIAKACQPAIDAGRAGNVEEYNRSTRSLASQLNGSLGRQARDAAGSIDEGLKGR